MGSFKANKRNQGPDRRRGAKAVRQRDLLRFEHLERRTLLDAAPTNNTVLWHATTSDVSDVKFGPMANAGADLIGVYQAFQGNGGNGAQVAARYPGIIIRGNSVGVDVQGVGDFNAFLTSIQNIGMQVTAVDTTRRIAEGLVPISNLLTLSTSTQTLGLHAVYKPQLNFVGQANNEAEATMNAGTARTQFGVTGAGVTVGVLSDSVNQFQGGLASSVASGDLPGNVQVIQDGAAGSTDEGRAMLENIRDIAPGAGLAFATADNGEVAFANNIRALATQANAKVIVDDVGYLTEPMFQDGIVSQGVIDVTRNNNAAYFSSAHNSGDRGYSSQFRGVNASPGSLGAGRYMDFDPGPGTTTLLPITVTAFGVSPGEGITMQFDQPWYTQGGVTSDVDIIVLDASGNVVAQGNSNNVATQQPFEFADLSTTTPGTTYFVAIRVVSGADPGHVQFTEWGNSLTSVSKQFGTAGGTFYPSTFGHPTSADAIGVGAVPWWGTNPSVTPPIPPVRSEPFSSDGPALIMFDSQGNPLSAPQLRLKPDISAPDGGDTSFFGFVADTSNPPFGGEPATPSNLSQSTPDFFGTSSAAPNAAAVAALLKQKVPTATTTDIRNAMIASAMPLNGAAAGVWQVRGGFGLIDAVKALSSIGGLQVISTTPGNGQQLGQAPGTIVVTFNQPVNINTVSAANLVFTNVPPGVTASAIGTPIGLDDPVFPTQVAFPISINSTQGVLANGNFTFVVQGGIVAQNGKVLASASSPTTFNLNDTIAPRVINTTINGRVITIQFSEAMRPSTLVPANFQLIRAGSDGSFGKPSNVNLSTDPRMKLTYDATTNTVTLDYSALNQSQFPSDQYALVVLAGDNGGPGVTDLVGNFLDGEFSGSFPSGEGDPKTPQNPTGRSPSERFTEFLGFQQLFAPIVTSVQLAPQSDSGSKGDENTNINQPVLIGQVAASFPGTVAGLTILAQFNGLHGGSFNLAPGGGGRGFVGGFDVVTTTDANGTFTLQAPFLPEGYNAVRIVVVGQPDAPPLPGLSSVFSHAFRIDRTGPSIVGAATDPANPGTSTVPTTGSNFSTLSKLSLLVVDVPNPTSGPLATPSQILFPALDPATANNITNYTLFNLDTNTDQSSFIATATFVPTGTDFVSPPSRSTTFDPFAGRIDLTFASGLPAGRYSLVVHTSERLGQVTFTGLKDAAGNALDNSLSTGAVDFEMEFTVQSQATFITNLQALSSYNGLNSNVVGGPRSFYELPALGQTPRANAPPSAFAIDFSTPLDTFADYTNTVQLIGSADAGGVSDGDFGTLGMAGLGSTGTGFSIVPGTTVTLADKTSGALFGQPGFAKGDRLVVQLAPGTTLAPDHYRIYIPNTGSLSIFDKFGNQLDGEFLGTQTGQGGYEDLLPNGQYRSGLSGDSVAGGAFLTSFVVVPNGNVIYAKPDYFEDPLLPSTAPDGSLARPYSALAIEANPATAPQNPTNNPNGGPNSTSFFFNFNQQFDRNGNGRFDRSALYAAQQLSTRGPVVVVALPGTPTRDPLTGQITQRSFVLQAPAGPSPLINDGSASVPFNTTLVFNPGSALKLQNASLYVQNQGSALQALGGINPNDQVNFTSFADPSVGGKTNGPTGKSVPAPGDWGGIVFRNFDNVSNNRNLSFPIDGTLQGAGGGKAISGADDALSILNFTNIKYSGGTVPQTQGVPASGITMFNSRPTVSNVRIAQSGAAGGGVNLIAAISGDLDSFREDDTARGPLIRRTDVTQNSLNGILIRPDSSGFVQQSDAIFYPDNPSSLGGARNFTLDDPLPYILTSQVLIGQQLDQNTGGQTEFVNARLYVQPGMMVKSQRGAGIAVVNNEASINIGSRTYINQFDANPNVSPNDTTFQANPATDARVLFTSIYDNTAFTFFFDPSTQQNTIIVPPTDSANSNGANQPTPGNVPALARWGSVSVQSGAVTSINRAEFRYGGGLVHGPEISFPTQSVLSFITFDTPLQTPLNTGGFGGPGPALDELGTHAMVTNNDFFDNIDTPMQIEPNGLLAGDPLRPLLSGHPYFRGNVMQRNDIDGMSVVSSNAIIVTTDPNQQIRRREIPLAAGNSNLTVNSVWDSTDLTYVVRGSIVLAGAYDSFNFGNPFQTQAALPDPNQFVAEKNPFITLTLQSALPGTLLADGTTIGRPGEPLLVKMMNDYAPLNAGALDTFGSVGVQGFVSASTNVGAGFVVGVDDGVDPPAANSVSPTLDPGIDSQIRIVGIPGDETTGQQRVPVIITSLRDGSVGKTVRGVNMSNIYNRERDPLFANRVGALSSPAPGDGGYIYFGGNSLTDYNLLDPRDGNIIDNADIRYLTRIEIQGGGVVDVDNSLTPGVPPLSFLQQKLGQTPLTQFNSQFAMTISNSNLAFFSDAAVFAHANSANSLIRDVTALTFPTLPGQPPPFFFAGRDTTNTQRGPGYDLLMYGNTISNSSVGVETHSDQVAPQRSNSPENVVLLHNTFYNNPIAFQSFGYGPNNTAPNNHVYWLLMDNIFSNSSNTAILANGVLNDSQAQYNLFFANTNNLVINGNVATFLGNIGAVVGDPDFRDPANGNFQLGPNSAAIDAARSEIGPLPAGDAIYPAVTQVLDVNGRPTPVSVRTDPASLTFPATPGRSNPFGGLAVIFDPRKIVELPGQSFSNRGFFDQWVPTLVTDPDGVSGPASNANTYNYKTLTGVRDGLGFLRQDDPNSPNIGFGSNPFYDIGAFEHRTFFPPTVTGVTATVTNAASPTGVSSFNIYTVGGVGGTNQTPQTISFQLNHNLDPNTISNRSVLLEGSGGDGLFGNGNSPNDRFIDLSGKLTFDTATSVLTIHLGDAGVVLPSDLYRVFLLGNGTDVLRDSEGNALDGENTLNDDPNNPHLPLPSGDNFPGGNFFLTFAINTESAEIQPGTFTLAPASDTSVRDFITSDNLPSFSGNITVQTPTINPLAGQIVVVDISTKGDGVFDRMNAGSALTNATGGFVVTVGVDGANTGLVTNTTALPDSPYSVGFDGLLNSPANAALLGGGSSFDDVNYSIARVRIINSSGNSSNTSTPNAFTGFAIDTRGPRLTAFTPVQGSLLTPDSSGKIRMTFTVDKNVDPATVNANSILFTGAGPDATFGTADDVAVPIDANSVTITPLKNGAKGPELISFTIGGTLANDQYAVTLKGTGASAITDIAGNPLNGANGAGGVDFNIVYVVFSPASSRTIFVGPSTFVTDPTAAPGSRANPFSTITAGLGAAVQGDTVAVLPAVYTESIALKSLVRLVSADANSSDASLIRGSALQTIIRAPALSATATTVTAVGLFSVPGLDTEISGFTIASPLLGDPAFGFLDTSSVGLRINNSNILVDRNYFVDSGFGIAIETSGSNAATPRIEDNGIIGNATGILVNDTGTTVLPTGGFANITNNTFAFNTFGVLANVSSESPIMARMTNNIFWQNHDLTTSHSGAAIYATTANKLLVRNNLFQGNGPPGSGNKYAGINVGNGFVPSRLGPNLDSLGNFTGEPAFVSPRDPRPGADGPASFFIDANFDLTSASRAIDAANNALAPTTDFLSRSRVDIPNRGFPGTGPADVGAFEFQGGGGIPVGGSFRVVTTSIAAGASARANGATLTAGPRSIVVDFSGRVDRSSVSPSDLVITGTGLNSNFPAKASSLTWIDDHTVRFNLSGGYKGSGVVKITLPTGSVKSQGNAPVTGFSDTFKLAPPRTQQVRQATPVAHATTNPVVLTPYTPPPFTPAPAAPPTKGGKGSGLLAFLRRNR